MKVGRVGRGGLAAVLGLASLVGAENRVTITEFMAANSRTLADQDREYSDWIELYNTGPESAALQGWFLTDRSDWSVRWHFPSTNLAANSYLVVFASAKDRATPGQELHTSFNLNAQGDFLALVAPEGAVAAEFAPQFPPQFSDISYGVYLGRNYYFNKPTPGAPNGVGFENFVADTKFSQDRGFYTAPFDLVISTATAGATIMYTTNGSLPSATNGLVYAGPLHVARTTVVRAMALREGFQSSNVDTQTYLFLEDVIRQSPTGQPPPGWPTSWGANSRDYGMDPDVVNNPKWSSTIKDDLQTTPSFSMVMDLKDLFNSSTGIYANAGRQGRSWERKCSLELIYPDGTRGFQIDAGVRIRGGYSRSSSNPKHAFRFFFREEYGAPRLDYPLFGNAGADEYDCIDLRCAQNYSWSFEGNPRGIHLRDQFSRDTQLAMGHAAERGKFYHLYINGQYWGLYNTCERPEASYGATYLGGAKEDYDVIKVEPGPYSIFATDGNLQAWTRLYNLCKSGAMTDALYEKLQGNNPDGTRNPDYENLVEVDNLVDYMLVIFYGGNLDAPISNFLSNTRPNNWYGLRNRNGLDGFRFFAHDAEHTLLNVNENRTGPYSAGDSSVTYSSPQWVFQKLMANPEFRLRVADRVHEYFFNGGLLTPESCTNRLMSRAAEIDRAVVGESARWGDAKRSTPITRDDWVTSVNDLLKNFFPQRSAIVLNQLKAKNLYPNVAAPSFNQQGGFVDKGFQLGMTKAAGRLFYTLEGPDPRLRGGAVSPAAQEFRDPIVLTESLVVKARVLDGANWSALNAAAFIIIQTYTNLAISEIMYHPLPDGEIDGDEFEFIELKNLEPTEIDLSGVHFSNGISYTFPNGKRLGPGQFAVLASNATNFAKRYPGVTAAGFYSGRLANGGETVTLVHATGRLLSSVRYGDQPPWPAAADGSGFSLVPVNPKLGQDPSNPASWRASSAIGGSPGADDPAPNLPPVVISEILTHTDPPAVDAVELHNPTPGLADISHWLLSDDRNFPNKYAVPARTVLPPGGYAVFTEKDFNPTPGRDPSFTLSSHGEQVFLFSADAAGNLTGYSDGFAFGAAANGVTFGRYTNSVGAILYPPQQGNTLGEPNSGPAVGPVVLNEIHYHPAASDAEFIELKNLTGEPVKLYDVSCPTNTWRIDGIGFAFPTNMEIAPQGLLLVVGGDPAAFRNRYGVLARVPICGPFPGALQDNGELLQLQRPDTPEVDTNGVTIVPYIAIDTVRYDNQAPWPLDAAGAGASLERVNPAAYGNDPANWRAGFGVPSPGLENDGNRPPRVEAGSDLEVISPTFPLTVSLQGTASDDGLPAQKASLQASWAQVAGPGVALLTEPNALSTGVLLPGLGEYRFRLTVSDGALEAADEMAVTAHRPSVDVTLIKAGDQWKYLDDGSNQGVAWQALDFDDSTWKQDDAQFGYNDGDEQTTVSYGQDSAKKHITTYFRKTLNLSRVSEFTSLNLKVLRDDGVVVYLNTTNVFSDNLPDVDIDFQTLASEAIGGADESVFLEKPVDPTLLREGKNVIAVEIHQCSQGSSDISFDLQLDAQTYPRNRAPTVAAGQDQTVTGGEPAQLKGSFLDDGLPTPPGVVSAGWSKRSGPGTVAFANSAVWETSASFSETGDYVLRLTVSDGEFAASDEVAIAVIGSALEPPRILSVERLAASPPSVRVRFAAKPDRTYRVQYRDSLTEGDWQTLRELQAAPLANELEFTEPLRGERASRYYRIVALGVH